MISTGIVVGSMSASAAGSAYVCKGKEMNIKPEDAYLNAIRKLIKDAYQLKRHYIDEPSFDPDGDLIVVPSVKFRSLVTQALMLTRHYKFIELQDDSTIFIRLSDLRDMDISHNQRGIFEDFIQLMDAIVSQIESGILCFRVGKLSLPAEGKLEEILSCSLGYMEKDLRKSIQDDIYELRIAAENKMHKSVALLAGSITEAVLLGVVILNPSVAENHLQGMKGKSNKKFPERCGIEEFGYICIKEHILTDTEISIEKLNDYRDHIHPNKHTKSKTNLDDSTVLIILGTLGKILNNLADSEKQGLINVYKEKRLGS